jgi:hypothetical protein
VRLVRPYTNQPQGVAKPSSWALSRKIQILTLRDHALNLVNSRRTQPTSTTGDYVLRGTVGGLGVVQTTGGYAVNSTGYSLNWSGDWTAIFIGAPVVGADSPQVFAQFATDTAIIGIGFDRSLNGVPGALSVMMLQPGVNRSGAYATEVVNGTTRCFLIRKQNNVISMFVDGTKRTVVTSDSFTGVMSFTPADPLAMAGNSSNGQATWKEPLNATAFFNSAFTDSGCIEASTIDGFYSLLFAPIAVQRPIAGAAPVDPVLSNLVATSITSTGAIPQVDYVA